MNRRGAAFVMTAGILWGTMGLFVRQFSAWGFTSAQTAALRFLVSGVAFAIILVLRDPAGFRIRLRDLPLYLGLGVCSITFFTICYFASIESLSLSTAAILLYTSPIWVMLMSALFFKERFTRTKVAALVCAFAGCALVSGVGSDAGSTTPMNLLVGLGSGVGYALYSILGTVALRRHSPYTVTTYTFVTAAISSLVICNPVEMAHTAATAANPLELTALAIAMGLITSVAPWLLYTLGLKEIEPSRAAILATLEPVTATVMGIVVFHEGLTGQSAFGIALVLIAILLLNRKEGGKQPSQ